MDLSLAELKSSKFADTLNHLRKHNNPTIANEAKRIRQMLKQVGIFYVYVLLPANSFLNEVV